MWDTATTPEMPTPSGQASVLPHLAAGCRGPETGRWSWVVSGGPLEGRVAGEAGSEGQHCWLRCGRVPKPWNVGASRGWKRQTGILPWRLQRRTAVPDTEILVRF